MLLHSSSRPLLGATITSIICYNWTYFYGVQATKLAFLFKIGPALCLNFCSVHTVVSYKEGWLFAKNICIYHCYLQWFWLFTHLSLIKSSCYIVQNICIIFIYFGCLHTCLNVIVFIICHNEIGCVLLMKRKHLKYREGKYRQNCERGFSGSNDEAEVWSKSVVLSAILTWIVCLFSARAFNSFLYLF